MIMKKLYLFLFAVLSLLPLKSEVIIDSKFAGNTALWYAMKNSGSVTCDTAARTLVMQNGSAAVGKISNWKQLTAAMLEKRKLKLSAEVKGSGELTAVFVLTVQSVHGGRSYPRKAGKPVQLGNEYKTVEVIGDFSNDSPLKGEVRFELKGNNAQAIFRSIKCEDLEADNRSSDASPNAVKSTPASCKGLSKAEIAQMQTLAQQIKLKNNARILILGDSLSDFDRGFNWIDKLAYFLGQPGTCQAEFYNYGIGGDDIKRVSRRFAAHFNAQAPTEYFQKRYKDLEKVKYDYIIVFLGQNDTKSSSRSNYSVTFVPQNHWQKYWETLLGNIKKEFPQAEIILCSPIHTDTSRQEKLAAIILQRRNNVWKFGMEKYMLEYAQCVQNICKKYQIKYIDLYTPSTPLQNKLFKSEDGVHLNTAGHNFMLKTMLENLN